MWIAWAGLTAGLVASLVLGATWLHAQTGPSEAVPQVPQPALASKPEHAPAQRSLPLIKLGHDVTQLNIDTQTEYWIDSAPDTTVDQVEARASSGAELFQPRTERQNHVIHGQVPILFV
jgi:hypothetical protein